VTCPPSNRPSGSSPTSNGSWTGSKAPRTPLPDETPAGSAGLSVRVRLFAAARDAAGTREATADAQSLGDLLDNLRARYGPDFEAVLGTARVWVNGEDPTDGDATLLVAGDEVAVLPPVSGGACR
jgi:molybdopterin synthase sulfur carrier subunit